MALVRWAQVKREWGEPQYPRSGKSLSPGRPLIRQEDFPTNELHAKPAGNGLEKHEEEGRDLVGQRPFAARHGEDVVGSRVEEVFISTDAERKAKREEE